MARHTSLGAGACCPASCCRRRGCEQRLQIKGDDETNEMGQKFTLIFIEKYAVEFGHKAVVSQRDSI